MSAAADASVFRVTPNNSCISAPVRPLPSKNAIFLSVEALRTSSSSKNFFACSMITSLLCVSTSSVSPSVGVVSFNLSCHDGTAGLLGPESESPILRAVYTVEIGWREVVVMSVHKFEVQSASARNNADIIGI